jgi:ribonuclease E
MGLEVELEAGQAKNLKSPAQRGLSRAARKFIKGGKTMTPQEQDVLAFMGISPLALFEGEVKNPRTAILQIQLPGQSNGSNGSTGLAIAESSDIVEVVSKETRKKIDRPSLGPSISAEENFDELPAEIQSFQGTLSGNDMPEDSHFEDLASDAPRRRRKRSSASVTGAKQLSLETED